MKRILRRMLYLITGVSLCACADDDYPRLRAGMVAEIRQMTLETRAWTGRETLGEGVIRAMGKVPRHEFVPIAYRGYAYQNRPLPIGNEQTISQPFIVALMTDLAGINQDSVVLEVGTGSGYQVAVLAELVNHVYTIEIIDVLGRVAENTLQRLGYANVSVRIGDGYHGWLEHAPFDAIIVTAAPDQVPEPLLAQLKPGGRLIVPVGPQNRTQSLRIISKGPGGHIVEEDVLPVGFVPLTRDDWK